MTTTTITTNILPQLQVEKAGNFRYPLLAIGTLMQLLVIAQENMLLLFNLHNLYTIQHQVRVSLLYASSLIIKPKSLLNIIIYHRWE